MHTEAIEGAAITATRPQCPTGRFEVTGEVVSTKIIPDHGYGISRKMLVNIGGGVRIFGTAPLGLSPGSIVRMRVTISPSKSDPTFGFYTRPQILNVKQKERATPAMAVLPPESSKARSSI